MTKHSLCVYAIRDSRGLAVSIIAADTFGDAVRLKLEMQAFHNRVNGSADIFSVGMATPREAREHEEFRERYQQTCRYAWIRN